MSGIFSALDYRSNSKFWRLTQPMNVYTNANVRNLYKKFKNVLTLRFLWFFLGTFFSGTFSKNFWNIKLEHGKILFKNVAEMFSAGRKMKIAASPFVFMLEHKMIWKSANNFTRKCMLFSNTSRGFRIYFSTKVLFSDFDWKNMDVIFRRDQHWIVQQVRRKRDWKVWSRTTRCLPVAMPSCTTRSKKCTKCSLRRLSIST